MSDRFEMSLDSSKVCAHKQTIELVTVGDDVLQAAN